MPTSLTPFRFLPLLFLFLFNGCLPNLLAQAVNCDTVPIVAQATATAMTCDNPVGTLTGLSHPTALQFWWNGPLGFTSAQRVISRPVSGNYTLTVTGQYGCTAQTTVHLADSCLFYPLVPPECDSPFDPPAESCAEVCVRQFIPGNYLFNNIDANPSNFYPFPCGFIHNDQWFAFVAYNSAISISAQAQNCWKEDGIQMALYDDCNGYPLACNGGYQQGMDSLISITANNLIPGKVYYLLIDGWEGDQCEYYFPVDIIPGNTGGPNPVNPHISGLNPVCQGAEVLFSFLNPPFATAFLWSGPPGTLFNGLPSPALIYVPDGTDVNITFGADSGFVCVRAINYFLQPSKPFCFEVKVGQIPLTNLPTVEVCSEDAPFELPWGDEAYSTGIYEHKYFVYPGCDSLVRQSVIVHPPKIRFLPPMTLCLGDCFEIGGTEYCQPGTYEHILTSASGCDSMVVFSLAYLNPMAEITGDGVLNCSKPTITLKSANAGNMYTWRNSAGNFLGAGNTLLVTTPGIYILELSLAAGGKICTDRDTVMILQDIAPPPLQVGAGGKLTCAVPELNLSGTSTDTQATFLWTGPGGLSNPSASVFVSLPGVYTLKATGLNGCTTTATVLVEADQAIPGIDLSAEFLTCLQTTIFLQVQTDLPNGQFLWTGPNGFQSDQPQPEITEPGLYVLSLTNPANGCIAQDSIVVEADFTLPPTDVIQQAPECGDSLLHIEASSNFPMVQFDWTGPNNFTAQGATIEVATPGWYQVNASTSSGCHSQIAVLVVAAPQNPVVTITGGGLLNCTVPAIPVQASADIPGCSFFWSGPNGFTSDIANPILPFAGMYQLVVTAPSGCTTAAEFEQLGDITIPVITASGGVLTCDMQQATLFATSVPPAAFFNWIGPVFSSDENPVTVSEPGIYTVVAILPNGCTSVATVEVVDSCLVNTTDPFLSGNGIVLSPNPSRGRVLLQSFKKQPVTNWRLFEMKGRLVCSEQLKIPQTIIPLDFTTLPSGVYLLAVAIGDQWHFLRLILLE